MRTPSIYAYRIARKFRGVKFSRKLFHRNFIFTNSDPIAVINDVNIVSRIKIFAGGANMRKPRKFYPAKLSSYTVCWTLI